MIRLLSRTFEVPVSAADAWAFLADIDAWPRWAGHIRRIDVDPPGPAGPTTSGVIRLTNGITSTFRMTDFAPPTHWTWVGPFLWLSVRYDHRFEDLGDGRARLAWTLDAEGFGASVLGRLFAAIYARNLDRAIPRLQRLLGDRNGAPA